MQFEKHYTRNKPALLPQIRQWLKKFVRLRADLDKSEKMPQGPGRPRP